MRLLQELFLFCPSFQSFPELLVPEASRSSGKPKKIFGSSRDRACGFGAEAAHAAFSVTKCHCGLGSSVAVPGTELAASGTETAFAKSGPGSGFFLIGLWELGQNKKQFRDRNGTRPVFAKSGLAADKFFVRRHMKLAVAQI